MATRRLEELMRQLAEEHEAMQAENQQLRSELREAHSMGSAGAQGNSQPQAPAVMLATPSASSDGDANVRENPQLRAPGVSLTAASAPRSRAAEVPAKVPQGRAVAILDMPTENQLSHQHSQCSKRTQASHQRTPTDEVAKTRTGTESKRSHVSSIKDFEQEFLRTDKYRNSRSMKTAVLFPSEEELRNTRPSGYFVHKILASAYFDVAMGAVIILNSVMIGLESGARLHGDDTTTYTYLENVFLCIYIVELLARLFAHHLACFKSRWVVFDAFLVSFGVLEVILKVLFSWLDVNGGESEHLGFVLALRIMRLLRLTRSLRLLVQFRTLFMLVQGLAHSGQTIVYAAALMCGFLYVFSCIGVEIIAIPWANTSGFFGDLVREYWYGVPTSMLTLIRFVTFDSIGGMYEPMIKEHNYLAAFFLAFLLVVSVALMNLVTAVIVEGAMRQANEFAEAEREYRKQRLQQHLPRLRELFFELDMDGSGFLSFEEVRQATGDIAGELERCLPDCTLEELFITIDEDEDGEVSIDEFCEGISRLAVSSSAKELFVIFRHLRRMRHLMEVVQKEVCHNNDAPAVLVQPPVQQAIPRSPRLGFDGKSLKLPMGDLSL